MEKILKKASSLNTEASLKKIYQDFFIFLLNVERKSTHTAIAYSNDLYDFLNFISSHLGYKIKIDDLSQLQMIDFRAFLALLNNQKISKTSISRKLSTIRTFFAYLEQKNLIKNDHLSLLKMQKLPKKLPRSVSDDLAFKSIESSSNYGKSLWVQKRNQALITLIYGCGLRIDEALKLNMADLPTKLQDKYLIIKGKGKKERIIPLIPSILDLIKEYTKLIPNTILAKYENNKIPLFLGEQGGRLSPRILQRIVEKVRNELNLDSSFTPHALRHSFASHLLKDGVNLRIIQELLGHSSLSATQRYLKIENKELLNTHSNFHPRSSSNLKTNKNNKDNLEDE